MKRTNIKLLSAVVIPQDFQGLMNIRDISLEDAKAIIAQGLSIETFIGHAATAEALSALFGFEIKPNRAKLQGLGDSDVVIAFCLNERLPEGKIIETVEELEEIGYTFKLMIPCLTAGALLRSLSPEEYENIEDYVKPGIGLI